VNTRPVFHLISYMVMFVGAAILTAALAAKLMHDPEVVVYQLLESSGIVMLIGAILCFLTRGPIDLSRRDGFGIVTFGWLVVANVGAVPFLMTGVITHPIDAMFETMSGFTTTGASIFTQIDELPYGILYWRSLTQWLGGMGVLLLCVAILPFLGIGGMQIYRAEMPGPSKDRLTPRIANTAKLLYGVYVILTFVQTLLLKIAGMTWFDAINHAFCSLSTGGFSTHLAGPRIYNSPAIEIILIVFMLIGGINFAWHFRAMRGDFRAYTKSPELKFYLLVWLVFSLVMTADLLVNHTYTHVGMAFLDAFFQSTSIITTTGFATADYDVWPVLSKMLLFMLMFSGGCAGSTTGGIKIMRSLVVLKTAMREIRIFMQPQAVIKVKLGDQPVDHPIVAGITAFVLAFIMIFAIGTLAMTFFVDDATTAASAVIACLGNIGPGFGGVGPSMNFSEIPSAGKLILTLYMMLGRLELFTVLIIFVPAFWKK
jgi:trk system potassium uptake protein TrkH